MIDVNIWRKLVFVLLFVIWSALESCSSNSKHSFQRSSVEQVPWIAVASLNGSSTISRMVLDENWRLKSLPIRYAVEKILSIKERAEEKYPLRDAVESIPPIPSYLLDLKSEYYRWKHDHENLKEVKSIPNRVVCYLGSWSWYRKSDTKFTPDYVDPNLCTHLVYAFASLNPENYTIATSDPSVDIDYGFYKKITSPEITSRTKVLISVGGWTDSTGDKYSKLVGNGGNRRRFVNSVIMFLRRYDFQGLHLDWNYPVCWQARCSEEHVSDRSNFVKLIQELRTEFNKHNPPYELAAAISGYKEIIEVGYDILSLNENLDFMSVMTYDYHGPWENVTGHLSPLYGEPTDQLPDYNVDATMSTLVLLGAEPSKLVMGIPFYGQSFTLADSKKHDLNDNAIDAGDAGEYTQQPGILSYYEICKRIHKQGWRLERNSETGTESYTYKGNQWVGFDDRITIRRKVEYVKKSGFGGVMTWTIDLDDYNNECCTGVYPLLREINVALDRIPASVQNDCRKPTTTTILATTATEPDYSTEVDGQTVTQTVPPEWTSTNTGTPSTTTTTKWTTPSTTKATSQSTRPTRPWWPPTLTTRSTHKPRPTTPVTTSSRPVTTQSTTRQTVTRPTTTTTRQTTIRPVFTKPSTETPDEETGPEETTPHKENECPSGVYYPDPTSCNSYYRCVYGKKRREHCAPGLHWSVMSETCDWPSKANCREHLVSEPQTQWTTQPSTVVTTTPSTSFWPTHPARPTVACINGEHYSVPGDCTSFYICDGGRLSKRKCPGGLAWNWQKRLCDWAYNVPCQQAGVSDDYEELFRTEGKYKTEDGCNFGQFARHAADCNKYYQCIWGSYKETRCPPGLYWNEKMLICDWPTNADCELANEVPDEDHTHEDTEPTTKMTVSTHKVTSSSYSKPTKTTVWWSTTEKHSTSSSQTPWWSWTPETTTSWEWKPSTESTTSWEWKPTTTTAATLPTQKPKKPLSGFYKVVCYFTNWAWYRPGIGKYFPEDTDPNLCTHVIYGFAVLDFERLVIRVYDSWADVDNKFYERVATLKRRGVKVSIAIGGWNDSAGDKYSRLVNSPSARKEFVSSVLRFMKKYDFDGLDLDWEYPKCWQVNCNKGPESDKQGFTSLVRELREAFDVYGYLLSSAVSPNKAVIDAGYDVKELSDLLDWIAVMTYDYHGQWDKKTGHNAPIYYIEGDDSEYFNVNYSINYWIAKGADRRKLVMGMPLYGQAFTLADASNHGLNAPSYGPGEAGTYTRAGGFLAYYEICDKVRKEKWTVVYDAKKRRGPYAYKGNQWVGYDDLPTIKQKVNLIKEYGLGGGMIWALDLDDFRNVCGQGYYPLLTAIAEGLAEPYYTVSETSSSWGPTTEMQLTPNTTASVVTTPFSSTKRPKKTTTRKTTTTTTTTPTPEEITEPETSESVSEITEIPTHTTTPNVTSVNSNDYFRVICYFTNWAWYRHGTGKYLSNDIDVELCTHIIYAFAVLDSSKLVIKPHDTWADLDNKFYEKVTALKNRGIKVLLAIGGWNDSAGNKYSRLVSSKQSRAKFIAHVVKFLRKYNFDGLDVDWEYPKCWQVNCKLGPPSDKQNFADFITELREAFNQHNFLLTAAVSANKKVIDEGYDVPLLSEKLDWISVMVYDYHGQWDEVTGHVAPMYAHPDDVDQTFNANFSIHYWVDKGADPRKIVMGMPMYGQSFTLASSKNSSLNSKAYGGGEAGESTKARGFLAFYEICDRILKKGWQVEYDIEGRMGPYAHRGNQWVSFDDQAMIKHKSQYVFYNDLGGAMIWALDLDDFRGTCGCGQYPLLKTINKVLRNLSEDLVECSFESNSRMSLDAKLFYQNEALELFGEEWRFENCEHGQVKKHPTDCTKYLFCHFGSYHQEQTCPPGLHFNNKRLMCDWPESAACRPSIMDFAESFFLNSNNVKNTNLIAINNSSIQTSKYKVICYMTNWSAYRYNNQLFPVQVLDSHLCTHLVYSFVTLDKDTLTIQSNQTFAKLDNEFFNRVKVLKESGVKVILAVGGWYDSMDDKYSRLVKSSSSRNQFIKHAVKFLKDKDFDGLEIDWEYPKCWQVDCSKGPEADKIGFAALINELRREFKNNNLLLSVAVSPSKDIIDSAYDAYTISSNVDWMSLMTYDYHGYWDGKTGHVAPLYKDQNDPTTELLNINFTVSYWLEKGVPSEKLVLGFPFYGQSFKLRNSSGSHGSQNIYKVGMKAIAPGNPGRHTRIPGFLSFYEICELIKEEKWKSSKDAAGHFAYTNDQWVSYNDVSDVKLKAQYIKEKNLGGAVVWSLDLDDFVNICGCGPNPLLNAINDELSTPNYIKSRNFLNEDCTKNNIW